MFCSPDDLKSFCRLLNKVGPCCVPNCLCKHPIDYLTSRNFCCLFDIDSQEIWEPVPGTNLKSFKGNIPIFKFKPGAESFYERVESAYRASKLSRTMWLSLKSLSII